MSVARLIARWLLRGVTTGSGAPVDHLHREVAVNESNTSFWYGFGAGVGDAAGDSHLLFHADGDRLWHPQIGADDGSTLFKGDGSALTGVAAASVAWADVTGSPTTLSGYGITDAVATGDSRLTDSREWTATTVSQAEAEAGTATTRRAWTAQRVFQAIAAWWAASAAKTKLDGIATGATANSADATLLARANHTGTQAASTITGLATVATSGAYADLSGIPATFAPAAHTQAWSTITSTPTTLAGYGITDAAPSSHVGAGGSAHAAATTSVAGFMAAADKTKLDGIAAGAQVNTVTSVAGKTGAVTLTASDVGAAAASHTHPASEISDSTAAGRAVLTAADAAAQRAALGLGTAATATAQTSVTDNTAARLMLTGAFGLGRRGTALTNLNVSPLPNGLQIDFWGSGTATNRPTALTRGIVLTASATASVAAQLAFGEGAGSYTRYTTDGGATWSAWA